MLERRWDGAERELLRLVPPKLRNGMKWYLRSLFREIEPVIRSEEDERTQLQSFLDWLLNPAYFLQTDTAKKREVDAHLKRTKRLAARLEIEARKWPSYALNHAAEELRGYVSTMSKHRYSRSKLVSATGPSWMKEDVDVSERILSAVLILKRLNPGASPYQAIQERLAARGYARHIRAWENRVARLTEKTRSGKHRSPLAMLGVLYGQFLHVTENEVGYSISEQQMLERLVSSEDGH